jgi:microcystin-dependent protein
MTCQATVTLSGCGVPAGIVTPFAGATAPDTWLLCDGSAVSRTTYADLFRVIGTTYGVGDGSTTFGLPDLRGRVAAGKDNMGGTDADRLTASGCGIDGNVLGIAGGSETHTLTTDQMPAHDHRVRASIGETNTQINSLGNTGFAGWSNGDNGLTSGGGVDLVENTGGSEPHPIVQPTIVLNYIIKA